MRPTIISRCARGFLTALFCFSPPVSAYQLIAAAVIPETPGSPRAILPSTVAVSMVPSPEDLPTTDIPAAAAKRSPELMPTKDQRVTPTTQTDGIRIRVTEFEFTGNTAISSEALNTVLRQWVNRALNFGELIQCVELIETYYKAAGFFLIQANLPPQKIKDGVIEIAISEGTLAETRLEGESRVSAEVVFGYLDKLPKGEALRLSNLERQILLINELAGGQASLDLQAGELPGTTDVVLNQTPENLITGRLEGNNYGLPATGVHRASLTLNANSPFNSGERISLNVMSSDTSALASYYLRGDFPIQSDGLRLYSAAARSEYILGGAFEKLKMSGIADSFRVGLSYPIVRSRASNLKVQFERDTAGLTDKSLGIATNKRSDGYNFQATADWQDDLLMSGSTRLDLLHRSGSLVLGTNALPSDLGRTEGLFNKTLATLTRNESITQTLSFQALWMRQWAGKNLDASEKLSVGSAAVMPGYSGEASGDEGQITHFHLRWQPQPGFAISAFRDYATVWLMRDPFVEGVQNVRFLSDYGTTVDWNIAETVTLSSTLAWAYPPPTNPTQKYNPRLWVNMMYGW